MGIKYLYFIVICVYCVRGKDDIKLYPEVDYGMHAHMEREALENRKKLPIYTSHYLGPRWKPALPWSPVDYDENRNKLSNLDLAISNRIRTLAEILEPNEGTKRSVPKPRYHRFHETKYPDQFDAIFENFRTYPGKGQPYPSHDLQNAQVLDDAYSEDFSFPEEGAEDNGEELADLRPFRPVDNNDKALENNLQAPEDSLFAYTPSDPRYYERTPQKGTMNASKDETEDYPNPETGIVENSNLGFMNTNTFSVQDQPNAKEYVHNPVQVMRVPSRLPTDNAAGVYIVAVVAGISAAATVGLIAFGIGWYNLKKHIKYSADVEYPAYGVTGPNKDVSPSGDRRLAQSAQMYHYQHQKQQIIAMESRTAAQERHGSMSEVDSDEENEEGDYTVYECPGLAPTGEMEVKNPMFQDDPTPALKSGDKGGIVDEPKK